VKVFAAGTHSGREIKSPKRTKRKLKNIPKTEEKQKTPLFE
jgi:hypothetical protein